LRKLLRWILGLLLLGMVLSVAAVLLMRWWPPVTSAFMLEARLEAWAGGDFSLHLHHTWVDRDRISPYVRLAVIASEDQKFPSITASTSGPSRTRCVSRKTACARAAPAPSRSRRPRTCFCGMAQLRAQGRGVWFTVLLELFWPKARILEVYLNSAQFGPDVYGVEAAAERYFHKHAAALTRSEAAQLAAVLPNPLKLHADRPSVYVAGRRQWILGQMRELGDVAYLKNL